MLRQTGLSAAFAGAVLISPAVVFADPLASEECDALVAEHETLAQTKIAADIRRGPEWAEKNLGQLRLQQVERLIEIEEQVAFRCRTTPLKTAVVIPELRAKKARPPEGSADGNGKQIKSALRASKVPLPVRRPKMNAEDRPVAAVDKGKPAPTSMARARSPDEAAATRTDGQNKTGAVKKDDEGRGTKTKDEAALPRVIRLQPAKKAKPKNSRSAASAKQRRARRKPKRRRARRDTYVPPPPNPGYQPSLISP